MGVYDHALRPERMVAAIIAVATLPASVVVVAFRSLVHLKLLGIPEEAGAFLLIATIALPFVLPPAGLALEGDRGFVVTKAKRIAALILTWGILWTYYLAPALIRAAVSLSGTLRRPVLVGALVWLTALVRHGFAQGLQAASGTVMTQAPRTPPTWEIGSIVALVALFTMAVLWMLLMIVPFWDPPVRVTHALFMGDSSKDPEKRKLKNYWLTMEGDWAEQSLRWRWNRYTLPWKIALAFVSTAALAAAILIGIQVNLGRFPDAGTLQILLMVTSAASFFGIPLALRGKGGWRNVWAVEDKKGVLADVRALMASSRNRLINLLLAGGAASTALILWSLLSLAATTPKPPSATENIPHVMVTTAAAKQPGLEGAA
jgi:hypothetical protein